MLKHTIKTNRSEYMLTLVLEYYISMCISATCFLLFGIETLMFCKGHISIKKIYTYQLHIVNLDRVVWGKAHPFVGKHDLACVFSFQAEKFNTITYTHILSK